MEAKVLTQRLTSKMIELSDYTIVERANIDKILKEQKFQHSGCTDSECAVEIGQLLNADITVIGTASKFGKTYTLDCRIINVENGEALASASYTHTGEIDELVKDGIESIAHKLLGIPYKKKISSGTTSKVSSGYGATLEINSDPPGAEIYIGGNYFDTTPLILEDFPAGDYEVELKLDGYEDYSQSISLLPRSTNNVTANLIAKASWIMVAGFSSPASVGIYIDGQRRSLAGNGKLDISPGSHTVRIASIGYIDYLDTLTIFPGKTITVGYNLERAFGYIHSAFEPQEALIAIDGETVANNSTSILNTGSYNLTAKLKNYYQVRETFSITRNDTTYINSTLQYGLGDYKKLQKNKKPRLYGAIASTGLTALSYFISGMLYNKYVDAENAQDATDLRNQAELFYTITNISGAVSAGVWGYTLYNYGAEHSLRKELGLDE